MNNQSDYREWAEIMDRESHGVLDQETAQCPLCGDAVRYRVEYSEASDQYVGYWPCMNCGYTSYEQ